ncbi:protein SIEVE ELEMENT OCCLUSION B-like [Gastrolobium bilobum]|uniref:protein SIEVE ELEMENT OCCLUSION B-like n=1 Tax=Gastrolobium bilobum TaxID=150636 RepID=UPI002AB0B4D2|nr:protein SIEVE ELEMENT OCCLUSION B-like [Gastrolobium bilobum]
MARLVKSILHLGGNGHNPLNMSDEHILEEIYSTHVHSDTKFDVDSLFKLVENILKRSTHIVDNVVQGNHGSQEQIVDEIPKADFFSPLCTLKQITSEMTCKPPGEEIAHKTTLAILKKLSSYSWDAKAVLTLAAFALEYGEFWLLCLHQPTDPLAKSLATITRVPGLTNSTALKKHHNAILELNNLMKTTWEVIKLILELEHLTSYDTKDVPALLPSLEQIPVDVYWAIITIVAIVTQTECLTTDSDQRQDLSHFGQKINIILSKLRKQMLLCKQQIEEADNKKRLKKMFQTPTEIVEVFKLLIFWKDTPQAPIYDGATKTLVNIEVLKKKNVFLFISTLDITVEEISLFKPIHDATKSGNEYKIVWVPIVEEWNDQLRKKFEFLKSKMPWFVLQHFAPIKGIEFIKEEWQFKKKPMFVVMSPQGKILHPNAFHMIQVWGLNAFPFTQSIETTLTQQASWIESLVININPQITTWEQKYIFFYGGKDKEWIQQFNKSAGALANDATLKEANISVELFCLEFEHSNVINRFWRGIESLFVTKMHKTTNTVTQEVQKMLSYKNETGWALLSKGSTVLLAGHGTTILKTVAEFDKWKGLVIKNGFEVSFKEQHDKVVRTIHRCSHLEIPNVAGKIPDKIECPECHRTMEVFISYKCCHNENTANAEH